MQIRGEEDETSLIIPMESLYHIRYDERKATHPFHVLLFRDIRKESSVYRQNAVFAATNIRFQITLHGLLKPVVEAKHLRRHKTME